MGASIMDVARGPLMEGMLRDALRLIARLEASNRRNADEVKRLDEALRLCLAEKERRDREPSASDRKDAPDEGHRAAPSRKRKREHAEPPIRRSERVARRCEEEGAEEDRGDKNEPRHAKVRPKHVMDDMDSHFRGSGRRGDMPECIHCGNVFSARTSTSSLRKHLGHFHPVQTCILR